MRRMTEIVQPRAWAAILCFSATFCVTGIIAQGTNTDEAKSLWEKVIIAKGGRENLHAIKTLVVSTKSYNPTDKKEFRRIQLEDFFVLPNKWWSWADQRPGFTLGINQFDFDKEVVYKITEGSILHTARPLKTPDESGGTSLEAKRDLQYRSQKKWFMDQQILYLMETKWFQPTIDSLRKDQLDGKVVDVIQVSVGLEKIEYYINPKSFLPNRIVRRTWIEDTKSYYVDGFYLEDYIEVGGVRFPQVMRAEKQTVTKKSYQVNVDYDKTLFDGPPDMGMGFDAWKRRP